MAAGAEMKSWKFLDDDILINISHNFHGIFGDLCFEFIFPQIASKKKPLLLILLVPYKEENQN